MTFTKMKKAAENTESYEGLGQMGEGGWKHPLDIEAEQLQLTLMNNCKADNVFL